MHALILGGTTEAAALAALLANEPRLKSTLSLAGRTRAPALPAIAHRIGGFGGAQGLAAWMRGAGVTALVDATHPFAKRMSFNAVAAAHEANIPLLSLLRPEWQAQESNCWQHVSGHEEAVAALGLTPRRVFLTVGRMELAAYAAVPQHHYVVRSVDPVEQRLLPDAVWLAARGPFALADELALFKEHGIEVVVTKNSGGSATFAKLEAARQLGVPVIMLRRPEHPQAERVATAEEAMQWLKTVHSISS